MNLFTPEQIAQIKFLGVECCYDGGGFNGSLHWGFYEEKLYVDYWYESRDVDGDWGTACTRHGNITFDELLETIKNPLSKFKTQSWN